MQGDTHKVVVIGGGPAGMAAAIASAAAGAHVTLCERQEKPGRKLSATGGGHCNITNTLDAEAFMSRFGKHGRFMTDALRRFSRDDLLHRMRGWGVPCEAADGFHYFPVSQKATDVLNALEHAMRSSGVEVRCRSEITSLEIADGHIRGVHTSKGTLRADAVVLATGGAAWPALGGCRSGYELAKQAGHTVTDLSPALVGLTTRETWPARCAGVTLPDVTARIDLPKLRGPAIRGTLLFTHTGVSGPVILDLSGQVTALLRTNRTVPVTLTLSPDTPRDLWQSRIGGWRTTRGKKTIRNLLDEFLPQSLATAICDACGIGQDLQAGHMTAQIRETLVEWMTNLPLTITGSEGFEQAMVTHGGVALRSVNPSTLESRLVRGLYFAGEVLDMDGPCGGYNLQWAFSSGHLAGLSAELLPDQASR